MSDEPTVEDRFDPRPPGARARNEPKSWWTPDGKMSVNNPALIRVAARLRRQLVKAHAEGRWPLPDDDTPESSES
jgi:hypothetical protein